MEQDERLLDQGNPRRNFLTRSALLAAAVPLALPETLHAAAPKNNGNAQVDYRSKAPAQQSDALARYAVNARFEDLDAPTQAALKLRILDLMGCVLAGVRATNNHALAEIVALSGSKPEASLIGFPVKGTVSDVAMTNAMFARSYDFEVMTAVVGKKAVASHHSPTTCMTALALAESTRASGRDFMTALAVGDDIAARLLVASGLDFDQGWDGSPVYSALGAVAIAARFRRLTPQQTRDAMGIAVDQIGGTIQNIWDASTDFKLPQGAVARNAILSVDLAQRGWTGMDDVLHAPFGFYSQYTAGCAQPEVITADLGRVFHGEGYFKPYPACMATHASIDCALALRSKSGLDPAQISKVIIRLSKQSLNGFCAKPFEMRRYPQVDANFSFQFMVANALLRGGVRQEHYAETAMRSPEMTAMLQKTGLAQLDADKSGVEIEVVMADGRKIVELHSSTADRHPFAKPSTRDDIVAKFRQQVAFAGYVDKSQADEIIECVDRIERETDMSKFVALLTRSTLKIQA